MGETQRLSKSRDKSHAAVTSAAAPEPAHAPTARSSGRTSVPTGAPFSIHGVQRKVAVGASNDAYERQADHIAARVLGGGTLPPGSISPIAPASMGSAAQRQTKPDEKKKEEKPAAPAPVQKQAKPEEKKEKEEKPAAAPPVQRAVKPED